MGGAAEVPTSKSRAISTVVRKAAQERARRQLDPLRMYEPMPLQKAFHDSNAMERVVIGSNRGGKTTCCAVEVARIVRGRDPRYPARDGRAYIVAEDLDQIGQVVWRKLSRSGSFKMIRDRRTKKWRSFRPHDEKDKKREDEAKPALPLIPPSEIKEIAWENKKQRVPKLVVMRNGWEISFYSSKADPPGGADIDLAWFDEEIVLFDWYTEIATRLLDRQGKFIWSAPPLNASASLHELSERADEEQNEQKPSVEKFFLHIEDNLHLTKEQREQFWKKLGSDSERRLRYHGEFRIATFKVYSEFDMGLHGFKNSDLPEGGIPQFWSRYAIVDPGYQICAVLFAAIPPPPQGDFVLLYDELYIPRCSAPIFASEMATKAQGQQFVAFVIDYHAGRTTEVSTGKTREMHYSEELKKNKVSSWKTGHGFIWGSDDVKGGLEAVLRWLGIRSDGKTKLRVLENKLPKFEWEISRYHYKVVQNRITEDPDQRRDNHLMDCLRYLAMYDPGWVAPPTKPVEDGYAIKALRAKAKRRREAMGDPFVRLGPGASNISIR